ncbi:hypothetical protein Tsubulata_050163 [Turnera subulata]|uniref:non-specific serine/threonine protein kinase n=1 Tax=Turnera subulata TaxID=218843 RepID=A0A9Q0JPW0_9ROSI|nr:hypothetical protein Tsubulata_050163 [Turnera subulata]
MKNCIVFCMILVLFLAFFSHDDHLGDAAAPTPHSTRSYITDQNALLALKAHITHDPYNSLTSNWSTTTPTCSSWIGVSCDPISHRVTYLNPGADLGAYVFYMYRYFSVLTCKDWWFSGKMLQWPPLERGFNLLGWLRPCLNLSHMGLAGTIPPQITNLSFLAVLDLRNNSFRGPLHDVFEHLPNLHKLALADNLLEGQIPSSLWKCKRLLSLNLNGNKFSGSISKDLANLTLLKQLSLSFNELTGPIPASLMNCTSLSILSAFINRLTGTIPTNIGEFRRLQNLCLWANEFHGKIPNSISIASRLRIIDLSANALTGSVPHLFSNLTQLWYLAFDSNQLTGDLSFISSLASCVGNGRAAQQKLVGRILVEWLIQILETFQKHKEHQEHHKTLRIHLGMGKLNTQQLCIKDSTTWTFSSFPYNANSSKLTPKLDSSHFQDKLINFNKLTFSNNAFNTTIPASIGDLSTTLQHLDIGNCKLKGNIPAEIGNLKRLIALLLGDNELTGSIPTSIGRFERLQLLNISYNGLEGWIPEEICQLRDLSELYLSHNSLVGRIPACLGAITSLRTLELDSNNLTSTIPTALWNLDYILEVNLSSNALTGQLPLEIGNMKVIIKLDLSNNNFSGVIPITIGSLQSLLNLSLENNKLQGHIPDTLQGPIPSGGTLQNFTIESFLGNNGLCSTLLPQFPVCKNSNHGRSKASVLKLILLRYILPAFVLITIIAVVFVWLRCCRRNASVYDEIGGIVLPAWRRISYLELEQATDGFCETNLIGKGGFGSVYKGKLHDGKEIAVKVFNLQQEERALRSFDVECQVMSNIRHRNLVKIISSCTNLDFKALILEYMPKGSLEKLLYSHCWLFYTKNIDRLNIMIDVASALHYLHHGFFTPIIHCDLKPSNILLDEDMVAHVSDLGIAKLLGEGDSMTRTRTMATIGYMSPEYGSEGIVSTKGDVYSFGMVLMEMITRKKPTDEIFNQGMCLRDYVKDALPDAITEIADANLLTREQHLYAAKKDCIHAVSVLAVDCTVENPEERADITKVVTLLKSIRIEYLANLVRIHLHRAFQLLAF